METGYLVVAKDGKEYGPLDRDTIQRWYFEGRLDQNSKVYEPGEHEFRLKDLFDLTVWNNPALIARAASASTAEPSFTPRMMSELAGEEDHQPTPGMFAAGILLIINAVMGLLVIGLIMIGRLQGFNNARGYIVPIIDVIVAAGLIRGNEKYRKWGLARAVLGGGFFLLGALVSAMSSNLPSPGMSEFSVTTVVGWIEVVFQLMFCAGIAALLWGDWPSKRRVGIGVAAVLVAWSGIITTSVVAGFVGGFVEQAQLAKYSIASATFEDNRLGVSARLPDGWVQLMKENPIAPVRDAAMIAVHSRSGCFATLLVEPDLIGGTALDDYLTLMLQNRQKTTPTMRELGRMDADFGGHLGRRLNTSWTVGGMKLRGFSTACKAGHNYYLLTGWCADESIAKAFAAFQSLEGVFEVGPRTLTEPPEIALESEEDFYELVFFIQEHKRLADGSQAIVARGTHEGTAVGFELLLGSTWEEGASAPGLVTYTGTAACRSLGVESDSLLKALDQLFETNQAPSQMKNETRFRALSLEGDPRDLEKGTVKLKLFFESRAQDRSAEVFTNIDFKLKRVYVTEKDPEYRRALVRALQAR